MLGLYPLFSYEILTYILCNLYRSTINKPLSFDTARYQWAGAGSGSIRSCIEPRGYLIHQPFSIVVVFLASSKQGGTHNRR